MNLLIVGGLLIVGVLALVATAFVLRSEPRTKAKTSEPPQQPVATEQSEPATHTAASEPSLAVQTAFVPQEDAAPGPEDPHTDEWHPIADGQFYELASELRTLHQQAQAFEYRLGVLKEMIERIEYAQNHHMTLAEDAKHTADVPSIN